MPSLGPDSGGSPPPPHAVSRRRLVLSGASLASAVALSGPVFAQHDHGSQDAATPVSATPIASPVSDDLLVRQNAKDLSSAEKKAFTDAILALKAKPSPWNPDLNAYDQFVAWHKDAFECDNMAAHMGPAFFPWHRAYLRLFEQQLQEIDPSVVLPYWDWTVDQEIDSYVWQDDLM